eukprot:1725423-Pleurochrysis_carterae.AAC.1
MAKTVEFFQRIHIPKNILQWLRVRMMYFLYSLPALYELTRGDDSTFSLSNKCPDMSTMRNISSDEQDGSNGTKRVKISLLCMHHVLDVDVNFECDMFMEESQCMYHRAVTIHVSQLENDCDDLMRALESVSIRCDFSAQFLMWRLPQHVDERQSERTLMVLSSCGCGPETLLWMKQQFDLFLHAAPSSEPSLA